MPQHHPKNVSAILKFCSTCRKMTMHRVDHKREGSCAEHAASGMSKKQEEAARKLAEEREQPKLF